MSWPVFYETRVEREWVDYNGHMNVAYYVLVFDRGTDGLLDRLGLGGAYHAATRRTIYVVEAHVAYLAGRIAFSHGQRDAAEHDLLRAAEGFEAAKDPMALSARHYAASARLSRNDPAGARADLENLLKAVSTRPDYVALGGLVRWELGRTMYYDDDWVQAAAILAEGTAMFGRAGERGNEGMMKMILAYALTSLGRNDAAWLARTEAFSALSEDGDRVRLAACVAVAVSAEMVAGHRDAALALSATEASIAKAPIGAISGALTHTDQKTTVRYLRRGATADIEEVAKARAAHRKAQGGQED